MTGDVGNGSDKTGDATANQDRQNQNGARKQVAGPQHGRQEARQANFGNAISALNNVNAQVENVNALNNVNVIGAVDVADVLTGNNVRALNNALNRNDADINVLRDAINNNEVLVEALEDAKIAVTDVIAVNVLNSGDVMVFIR